jgi:hypothetical protein
MTIRIASVILNNFFNFVILQNLIEFNKVLLTFNCRILKKLQRNEEEMIKINSEGSMKI